VSLAKIWAGVLGLQRVGIDDDYFALGGQSLLAASLFSKSSGCSSDVFRWQRC